MIFFFIIFSSLFVSSFGNDAKIQCDSYNQKYPTLTITKINSEITTKTCDDFCINYLCPVNFFATNITEKIYAMGSGCIENVRTNCGNNELGFRPKPDLFFANYVIASVCVGENGVKKCGQSLPSYLQWVNQDVNNIEFGWGYAKDIQYKPDVDGTLPKTTPSSTTTTTLPTTKTITIKTTTTTTQSPTISTKSIPTTSLPSSTKTIPSITTETPSTPTAAQIFPTLSIIPVNQLTNITK